MPKRNTKNLILPPNKREVLRHHLDELLRQGIIAPVSEKEDLPITSPIILVSKRTVKCTNIKHGVNRITTNASDDKLVISHS